MKFNKLAELTKSAETSEQIIHQDVMRYKRNKQASSFAFLGLAFNCLYFMLLYAVNDSSVETILIGVSVIITLCELLLTFFAEEGIKVYNRKFSYMLVVLAAIQFIRIFIYPIKFAGNSDITVRYFGADLSNGAVSAILIIYLVLSCACLLYSAAIGFIRSKQLENFNKDIEEGKINIDEALKDLDAKDEAAAVAVAEAAVAEETAATTAVSDEQSVAQKDEAADSSANDKAKEE